MTFKRKATPVAVLAVAALALTACAQSDRDDSGSDTGSTSGSDGGTSTFTFGAAGAPKVMDPFYATDGETFRVTRQMFEGLVGIKAGSAEIEPELAELDPCPAHVEDADDDALAVHGRRGGNAQIDSLAQQRHPRPPVLRQAALGNVQLGQDLDARDHGRRQPGRRGAHLTQAAMNAVAHAQRHVVDLVAAGAQLHRRGALDGDVGLDAATARDDEDDERQEAHHCTASAS